jgi:hypothetical protein
VLVSNTTNKKLACPVCDKEELLKTVTICDNCARMLDGDDIDNLKLHKLKDMICQECHNDEKGNRSY